MQNNIPNKCQANAKRYAKQSLSKYQTNANQMPNNIPNKCKINAKQMTNKCQTM